jgi:hypothetical protein
LLLNIVDGCNLNCKGCKNFSPLAKATDIYTIDQIKKDLSYFKGLGIKKLSRIFVSGGEPLLHPHLFEVLTLCRELYKNSIIELVTNGIVLHKYNESQWQKLKELDITLSMSDYNIGGVFPENLVSCRHYGVKYNTMTQSENTRMETDKKSFVKWTLNLEKTAPDYTYFNCKRFIGRTSLHLHNGVIAPCCLMVFSNKYFNDAFNCNMKMIENEDCLNLYKSTAEEILGFAVKRYPYCNYCDMEKNHMVEWGISERKIEEWT